MFGSKSKKQVQDDEAWDDTRRQVEAVANEGREFRKPIKQIDFQLQAIVGNIIFSNTEVWAYYDIPTDIYDFLSNSKKVAYAQELTAAFSGLVKNQDKVLDCHLRITNSPIDIDQWEEDYETISKTWHRRVGFQNFIDEQIEWLKDGGFFEKRVYLGVCLGRRHELDTNLANPFNAGFQDAFSYIKHYIDTSMMIVDKQVRKDEITHAQMLEKDLYTTVNTSRLAGERSTTEDLALLIKKSFYPAMPTPYLTMSKESWGRGDMVNELGSIINTKDPKILKFTQVLDGNVYHGCSATLTFKKFNESMNIPYGMPWIYASIFSQILAPFDVNCRFSLVPAKKIKSEIEKGINERKDAIENAAGADQSPSPTLLDEMARAQDMQREVENNKTTPWVSGTFRIIISAPNEDTLTEYCKQMMSFYDESMGGTKLVWTFHDQLDCMLESMPGDHLRENSFIQTTNLGMLSTSGFNILNEVGD